MCVCTFMLYTITPVPLLVFLTCFAILYHFLSVSKGQKGKRAQQGERGSRGSPVRRHSSFFYWGESHKENRSNFKSNLEK